MPNQPDADQELMRRFMRAYAKADADALRECLSADFVWHQHEGPEAPNGRTLEGVEAMVETIKWRQANWRNVRYDDMKIRSSGDLITQTFRVSGIDENGREFDCRAVDLYPIRAGKLTAKDTYWKKIV